MITDPVSLYLLDLARELNRSAPRINGASDPADQPIEPVIDPLIDQAFRDLVPVPPFPVVTRNPSK